MSDVAYLSVAIVTRSTGQQDMFYTVARPQIPVSDEDGCRGCDSLLADVALSPGEAYSEAYCWTCVDTWPAEAVSLAQLGLTVFIGRDRGVR